MLCPQHARVNVSWAASSTCRTHDSLGQLAALELQPTVRVGTKELLGFCFHAAYARGR